MPVLVADVYGERLALSLAEAARIVLDAGGTIERGQHGELEVRLPQQLTGEPMLERDARAPLVNAAELLIAASRVVLAAIDAAEGARGKRRLDERLPDRAVTLGGGVA